jgi:hypothetical protein
MLRRFMGFAPEPRTKTLARHGTTIVQCGTANGPMSVMGQKRTFRNVQPMSALPPNADISRTSRHVRFVPKPDMSMWIVRISIIIVIHPND